MNQKIIILRGLPGSGKSTWSKEFVRNNKDFVRIGRDDLRFMMVDGYMIEDDKAVFLARKALIEGMLREGYDLVLDESYLNPIRVRELNKVLEDFVAYDDYFMGLHLDIKIQDFINTPLKICLERNRPRGLNEFVPESFIKNYHKKYIVPLLKDRGKIEWTI